MVTTSRQRLEHAARTSTTAVKALPGPGELVLPLLAIAAMLAVILAAGSFISMPGGADHVVERQVLEDPSAQWGIEDVVGMEFAPMAPVLAASYTPSAHWIRLRVEAHPDGRPLVLHIRPTFLDSVVLFEPDPAGTGWRSRATGDRLSFSQRETAAVALALEIEPEAPDTVYYLRLETTSSSLFGVQALDWHDMRRTELASDALMVVFLAITWCILLWSIGDLFARPEPITVIFVASQLCYMLYVLAVMGYLAPLLPKAAPGTVDELTNFLVCLTPALGVMLHRQIFLLYAPARIVSTVSWIMFACAIALIIALMSGHTQFAVRSNSTLIFLSSTFYFAMAFWPWKERAPSLLLRTLYAIQAIAFVVTIAPLLGFGSLGEWTFHYPYILVLAYGAQMFFVIQRRAMERDVRDVENHARLDLVSQALGAERRQRDVQDRFTAMLVHEIRNPLATIRLSLDPARLGAERYRDVRDALAEIDAVVERSSLADEAYPASGGVRFDLAEALRRIVTRHAPAHPVRIDTRETLVVDSDRQMVDMVLSNLVENAIKYAPADSPILLTCRGSDRDGVDGVAVSIENEAAAAGHPDPARVFDKFYRAPGARQAPGSGLGLYVVAGVTEMLSGRIACTVAGDRVRFEFWLPIVPPGRGGRRGRADEAGLAQTEPGR
jgi:two-component system, sensor histidine kinase LadS